MSKADLETIHAQLSEQIADLVDGDAWQAMLATAAKFHRYSLNNLMLIARQNPDATRVAGYGAWRKLGRQVRKGEKGIRILAPARYKSRDAEGTETWQVRGFTVVSVFDVSQTDGEPLPDEIRPQLLAGEAPANAWVRVATMVADHGFTIERGDCGQANGYVDYAAHVVRVRADVDDAQALKTLIHELGHIECGHDAGAYLGADRCRKEIEAESVAYVVGQVIGLTTTDYSLPYVAGWAGGDVVAIRETAGRVIKAAGRIIDAIAA